jgi:hypothetical protein
MRLKLAVVHKNNEANGFGLALHEDYPSKSGINLFCKSIKISSCVEHPVEAIAPVALCFVSVPACAESHMVLVQEEPKIDY